MNVLVIFAHPYFEKSRVNKHLLEQIQGRVNIQIHDITPLYLKGLTLHPSDLEKEHALLIQYDRIVLQFPFMWYSVPFNLKRWMDEVLSFNFCYGPEGDKLKNKELLLTISTGGALADYSRTGYDYYTIEEFMPSLYQIGNFTGMKLLEPFFIHGTANHLTDEELLKKGKEYALYIDSPARKFIGTNQ